MSPHHLEVAPAKLTRSLRVTGRREDGYHLIESEMASIDLADRLEITDGAEGLEVVDAVAWLEPAGSGPDEIGGGTGADRAAVPTGPANLVARALAATGRSAKVRLEKRIPVAAGLGGGSADAAAILRWAGGDARVLAPGLGADVPFCVRGGRATVRGIGEIVEPMEFEPFTAVVLTPPFELATPAVYRAYDELGAPAAGLGNDLEAAAFAVEPRLGRWRALFSEVAGATARLAGSGSTLFVECGAERADALARALRGAVLAELRRPDAPARGRALVTAVRSVPSDG